jgi:hypothetical protein
MPLTTRVEIPSARECRVEIRVPLAFRLVRLQHVERRPRIGGRLEYVRVDPCDDSLHLLARLGRTTGDFAREIDDARVAHRNLQRRREVARIDGAGAPTACPPRR